MKTRLMTFGCLSSLVVLAGCYRVVMPGLSYSPPDGWIREEPTSEHRMIQYRLRGETEQVGDACLVVYYFGQQGAGGVESQMDRWISRFEQPDGRPSRDVARIQQRDVNGFEVHVLSLEGTYVAAVTPGSDEHLDRPGRRLEAAVVFTEAGPYYFKVVGPSETVTRWEASCNELLASLKPEPVDPESKSGSSEGSPQEDMQ